MPAAAEDRDAYAVQLDAAQAVIAELTRDNDALESELERREAACDWHSRDLRTFYGLTAALTLAAAVAPVWITAPLGCVTALYLASMTVRTIASLHR